MTQHNEKGTRRDLVLYRLEVAKSDIKSAKILLDAGVSSFLAAAAALKKEFTLPDVSQTVICTRMEGRTPVPEKEKLESLASHRASMAIFLSVQMIEEVVEKLLKHYEKTTPIAVVQRASWADEKIVTGTLENISQKVKEEKITKTAQILVGALFRIKIQGNKDVFTIMIDTSGNGLHKRGYRNLINEAPLKETMAAALVKLSRWKGGDRPFLDPMCGTGTIAIEAAMIGRNIAPGVNRNFAAEDWKVIPKELWIDLRDEAFSQEDYENKVMVYASDIDPETIKTAIENAEKAGVEDDILFETKNFLEVENMAEKGCLVTNPPYGERLLNDEKVERLYRLLGDVCRTRFPKWSYYIITSYPEFEKYFDKKATKKRKLYNGGIECHYYQYYGEK